MKALRALKHGLKEPHFLNCTTQAQRGSETHSSIIANRLGPRLRFAPLLPQILPGCGSLKQSAALVGGKAVRHGGGGALPGGKTGGLARPPGVYGGGGVDGGSDGGGGDGGMGGGEGGRGGDGGMTQPPWPPLTMYATWPGENSRSTSCSPVARRT